MESLKIGFLVDKSAPFYVGGYEIRVLELAQHLASSNEVRVYTSLNPAVERADRVGFYRASSTAFLREGRRDRSLLHSLLYSVSLCRNPMRDWDPDVVIFEAIPYLHLQTTRLWVSRVRAKRVLNVNEAWMDYSYSNGVLEGPARSLVHSLLATGVRWADLVLAISKVTAESLKRNYGAANVQIVPMGVDYEQIRQAVATPTYSKVHDFVSLGRLVPIKRFEDLVRAFGLLKAKWGWEGTAVIIGDGPLRAGLMEMADGLGLHHQVRFVGAVIDAEKLRLLSQSKIFVLPSEREGFSLATLEALACGLPAIVAIPTQPEVFGVSDLVKDGFDGIYYKVGDPSGLAKSMQALLDDGELLARMSGNAERIAAGFDWRAITSELERSLRGMLEG